jgi:hypothetical protein
VTIHGKHYGPDPYNDQWEGLQDQFVGRIEDRKILQTIKVTTKNADI